MNQEYINQLNRSIKQNEIEAAIVSKKRKIQDMRDSLLYSIRLFRRTNTNSPYAFPQK
jgi:hypothetical protein